MPEIRRVSFEMPHDSRGSLLLEQLQAMVAGPDATLEKLKIEDLEVPEPFRPRVTWAQIPRTKEVVPLIEEDNFYECARRSSPKTGAHCVSALSVGYKLGLWPAWRKDEMAIVPYVHRQYVPGRGQKLPKYYSSIRADRMRDLLVAVRTKEVLCRGLGNKSLSFLERCVYNMPASDYTSASSYGV